ncbi:MAG: uroporphyrinogen-III synthase [Bryobacteraceae bacterium]
MNTLAGQRIVVTRAAHQAEELAAPLRESRADVILVPVIGIVPPADPQPLKAAAARLNQYDWVIFSSANAVEAIREELGSISWPPKVRIATVGEATRQAAEELGWHVDVVPDRFVAEALVESLAEETLRGSRVLLPTSAIARPVIPQALMEKGAVVDVVEAYRNVLPEGIERRALEIFSTEPLPDWLTFTSSSAADNLVKLIGAERLRGMKIASIGPITSASVLAHGLLVHAQPDEHTVPALVEAIKQSVH